MMMTRMRSKAPILGQFDGHCVHGHRLDGVRPPRPLRILAAPQSAIRPERSPSERTMDTQASAASNAAKICFLISPGAELG